MPSAKAHPAASPVGRLLAGYRPLPGVADELVDAAGQVRPVWRGFVDYLARMPQQEVKRRLEQGDIRHGPTPEPSRSYLQ